MVYRISSAVVVNANVSHVYKLWLKFEDFPRFMTFVKSVEITGERTSHWVVEDPLRGKLEWDAVTTELDENRAIAWESAGGRARNGGRVTFAPLSDDQTEVTVSIHFEVPGGILGEVLATLSGLPQRGLERDLGDFKKYAEQTASQ